MAKPNLPPDNNYTLADRYDRTGGRIYATGTQALVRIVLDQAARDRAAGLNTAGFVTGYRGSPLGGVVLELWRIPDRLKDSRIEFLPAAARDFRRLSPAARKQVDRGLRALAEEPRPPAAKASGRWRASARWSSAPAAWPKRSPSA